MQFNFLHVCGINMLLLRIVNIDQRFFLKGARLNQLFSKEVILSTTTCASKFMQSSLASVVAFWTRDLFRASILECSVGFQ